METLIAELKKAPSYPCPNSLKIITNNWRDKTLVNDVIAGKTTFAKEIFPLVEENLKCKIYKPGTLDYERFSEISKKAKQNFSGILQFVYTTNHGRGVITEDDLTKSTEPLRIKKDLTLCFFMALLMSYIIQSLILELTTKSFFFFWFTSSVLVLTAITFMIDFFFAYPSYLAKRRRLTKKILADAEYLDLILGP